MPQGERQHRMVELRGRMVVRRITTQSIAARKNYARTLQSPIFGKANSKSMLKVTALAQIDQISSTTAAVLTIAWSTIPCREIAPGMVTSFDATTRMRTWSSINCDRHYENGPPPRYLGWTRRNWIRRRMGDSGRAKAKCRGSAANYAA